MHTSRETFTLCSILGPPIPKGNANGNIFSILCQDFWHMYHHMPIELAQNAETWQGQKYQKNHIQMCVVMGLVQWRNNTSRFHS